MSAIVPRHYDCPSLPVDPPTNIAADKFVESILDAAKHLPEFVEAEPVGAVAIDHLDRQCVAIEYEIRGRVVLREGEELFDAIQDHADKQLVDEWHKARERKDGAA